MKIDEADFFPCHIFFRNHAVKFKQKQKSQRALKLPWAVLTTMAMAIIVLLPVIENRVQRIGKEGGPDI
uniref:Uncharacterized protein n=1 Tax=Romanomermis culicivorax TaxID=13658 RepID=A0A915HUS9_ROMCU